MTGGQASNGARGVATTVLTPHGVLRPQVPEQRATTVTYPAGDAVLTLTQLTHWSVTTPTKGHWDTSWIAVALWRTNAIHLSNIPHIWNTELKHNIHIRFFIPGIMT